MSTTTQTGLNDQQKEELVGEKGKYYVNIGLRDEAAEGEKAAPKEPAKPVVEPVYEPPEGAPKRVWPIARGEGQYALTDGSTIFGTRATYETTKAIADKTNLRYKESEESTAAETAKFPVLDWSKESPSKIKTLRSETDWARFLNSTKEVGKIRQAYGHDVPVYASASMLMRVSQGGELRLHAYGAPRRSRPGGVEQHGRGQRGANPHCQAAGRSRSQTHRRLR